VDEKGSREVDAECGAGAGAAGDAGWPEGGSVAHEVKAADNTTSGSFDMRIPVRTASGEVYGIA
jgi:hypothetical protein